jgi:pantoate--beta-alanine ligase
MIELATVADMRAWSRAQRQAGRRIGYVPTMGYLHEGHLRLVDHARRAADAVVMSVFVNPIQFGPHEDLARYPRDLDRDRRLAVERGVDCLFVPGVDEMYPTPVSIMLTPGPLGDHLCGPRRPGHFAGVLTVVAKLFHIVEPDSAVFGRKDAQQAQIIRRMVADLSFPVRVDVAPTVREPDGLALSSRNIYLSPPERRAAAAIPRALTAGHDAYRAGARRAHDILAAITRTLATVPGLAPEYVAAVHPETLAPVETADAQTLVALAVRAGATRLIDNIVLGQGLAGDPVLDG